MTSTCNHARATAQTDPLAQPRLRPGGCDGVSRKRQAGRKAFTYRKPIPAVSNPRGDTRTSGSEIRGGPRHRGYLFFHPLVDPARSILRRRRRTTQRAMRPPSPAARGY